MLFLIHNSRKATSILLELSIVAFPFLSHENTLRLSAPATIRCAVESSSWADSQITTPSTLAISSTSAMIGGAATGPLNSRRTSSAPTCAYDLGFQFTHPTDSKVASPVIHTTFSHVYGPGKRLRISTNRRRSPLSKPGQISLPPATCRKSCIVDQKALIISGSSHFGQNSIFISMGQKRINGLQAHTPEQRSV